MGIHPRDVVVVVVVASREQHGVKITSFRNTHKLSTGHFLTLMHERGAQTTPRGHGGTHEINYQIAALPPSFPPPASPQGPPRPEDRFADTCQRVASAQPRHFPAKLPERRVSAGGEVSPCKENMGQVHVLGIEPFRINNLKEFDLAQFIDRCKQARSMLG